jgi:regulator of RNase E activity RraA
MKKQKLLILVFAAFLLSSTNAQNVAWPPEAVVALTSQWKGERLPDGRPKVSDEYLERLKKTSLEEVWSYLRGQGYNNQVEQLTDLHQKGWMILHPEVAMTGRVLTAQFVPRRPDFNEYIQAQAKKEGTHTPVTNYAPIIKLTEGDIYVADGYGKMQAGTLIGDNLADAINGSTKRGFIFYGSIRDQQGMSGIEGFNGWFMGQNVTGIAEMLVAWMNAPIRIGNVTVLPGDVALCNQYGIVFIPAHLVEECLLDAEYTQLRDQFNYWARATKKFVYINERFDVEPEVLEKAFKEWVFAKSDKELPMPRKQLEDYIKRRDEERAARMKNAPPR